MISILLRSGEDIVFYSHESYSRFLQTRNYSRRGIKTERVGAHTPYWDMSVPQKVPIKEFIEKFDTLHRFTGYTLGGKIYFTPTMLNRGE